MKSKHTHLSEKLEEHGGQIKIALDTKVKLLKDLALTFINEVHQLGDLYSKDRPRRFNFYIEVRQFEIDIITYALQHYRGNQARAAQLLGLNPTTLHAKIKQYGISVNRRTGLTAHQLARYSAVRSGRALADLRTAGETVMEESPTLS